MLVRLGVLLSCCGVLVSCLGPRATKEESLPQLAWPDGTVTEKNAGECWVAMAWALEERGYMAQQDVLRRQQLVAGRLLYQQWVHELAEEHASLSVDGRTLMAASVGPDASRVLLEKIQAGLEVRPSWVRLAKLPGLRPIPESLETFLRSNDGFGIKVCRYGDCTPALEATQEPILARLLDEAEAVSQDPNAAREALAAFFGLLGVLPADPVQRERIGALGSEWLTLQLEAFRGQELTKARTQVALDTAIGRFQDQVRVWEEDERLRDALRLAKPEVDHLQAELFERQTDLWYQELRLATENGRFAGVYSRLERMLSQDVGSDRQAKRRQRAMWAAYWAFLLRAHDIWLQTAEDELTNGHFGTVLTLCRTLREFVQLAERHGQRLPPGMGDQAERREHLETSARNLLAEQLERRVVVRTVQSTAGEEHGAQFVQRVRVALELAARENPLMRAVTVAEPQAVPEEQDYVLVNCRIEDLSVELSPPEERQVTAVGRILAKGEFVQFKERRAWRLDRFFEHHYGAQAPGPMAALAWAEEQALAAFAEQIAVEVGQFPFRLIERAEAEEKRKRWRQAAHFWGACAVWLAETPAEAYDAWRDAGVDVEALSATVSAQALSAATRAIAGTR